MLTRSRTLLWLFLCAMWVLSGCGSDAPAESANPPSPTVEAPTAPVPTRNVAAEDVDTAVGDGAGAEPTSTAVSGRSRGQQSTSEPSYASIRDVDFYDGFSYSLDLEMIEGEVVVQDGEYQIGERSDIDYFWFGISDLNYGDLDGDGVEEAVMVTTWNGGGTGYFDSVRAFRLVEGQVEPAGTVTYGDRADGGVYDLRINDGILSVWHFSTTLGSCCPNEVTETRHVLGPAWLVRSDSHPRQAWFSTGTGDGVPEVKFLPGTSAATIAVYSYLETSAFTFEAQAGQPVSIDVVHGPAPADLSITDLTTGEVMSALTNTVLPSSGLYEVGVTYGGDPGDKTTLELHIGSRDDEPAVTWVPSVIQTVLDDEPSVVASVTSPILTSDKPGTEAANEALAEFARTLDDYWIEDVTVYSEPQDISVFEVSYFVKYVSDDLVSIRYHYYDYVCCRPYPNYGTHSTLVDLRAGRLLELDDIIAAERIDDFRLLWYAELVEQNSYLDIDPVEDLIANDEPLGTVTLVEQGIEITTDRGALVGGSGATETLLTFEQLSGMLHPDLVARLG